MQTNLLGAYHCLELARRDGAQLVFLSTSRVYPVAPLQRLALREDATRFSLLAEQPVAGASAAGISEAFPLDRRADAVRHDEARRRAARSPSTPTVTASGPWWTAVA